MNVLVEHFAIVAFAFVQILRFWWMEFVNLQLVLFQQDRLQLLLNLKPFLNVDIIRLPSLFYVILFAFNVNLQHPQWNHALMEKLVLEAVTAKTIFVCVHQKQCPKISNVNHYHQVELFVSKGE